MCPRRQWPSELMAGRLHSRAPLRGPGALGALLLAIGARLCTAPCPHGGARLAWHAAIWRRPRGSVARAAAFLGLQRLPQEELGRVYHGIQRIGQLA